MDHGQLILLNTWVGGHRPFLAVPSFFHVDILQSSKALVSKECLFLDGHGFKSQEVHKFLVMGSNPIRYKF